MYTNPRPGQYFTHAHSHFTRAVAAADSCFALIGAHQRGKAVGLKNGENPRLKNLLLPRRVQSILPSASSTQRMWELLAGNRAAVLPRHARGRWITSYQYIEARGKHTPTHGLAIISRMCTAISRGQWQPWTAVSPCLTGAHQHGIAVGK